MFRRALTLFGQGGGFSGRLPRPTRTRGSRGRSSGTNNSGPSSARTGSLLGGLLEAGLASGGLSLLGDLLAQHLTSPAGLKVHAIDWPRSVRIASFGFLLYGPYQYWWYGALAKSFPTRSLPHFLSKVAANQLILGPIVVSAIFAWNLGLQGQLSNLPSKLSNDFATTVVNGWKFWVPAASVNFFAIPLQHQVWYMSACGLLWVTYLSYSATHKQSPLAPKTA
ncbi:CGL67 [Auxenochlorella protothecoides x Auxenochlorella symbiontica]